MVLFRFWCILMPILIKKAEKFIARVQQKMAFLDR